jgi:hypothetical protein
LPLLLHFRTARMRFMTSRTSTANAAM